MSYGRRRATAATAAFAAAVILLIGGLALATAKLNLVSGRGTPLSPTWQHWAQASLMPTVRGRVTVRLTGCPALPRAAGCVTTAVRA